MDIYTTCVEPAAVGVLVSALTAQLTGDGVQLRWEIAEGEGIVAQHVYRSGLTDLSTSVLVAKVPVKGGRTGYGLTDTNVESGHTYRYFLELQKRSGETETASVDIVIKYAPRTNTLRSSPNPFASQMTLHANVERGEAVSVMVYDVSGRPLATLYDGVTQGTEIELKWDGTTPSGEVPAGVYFMRLVEGTHSRTIRVARIIQ